MDIFEANMDGMTIVKNEKQNIFEQFARLVNTQLNSGTDYRYILDKAFSLLYLPKSKQP
ncbi:MAG: hypothetical protein H7249_17965 [Chitinophagaceae bacterium]|nr:hypothetical protein [Oligoflexus sp.]